MFYLSELEHSLRVPPHLLNLPLEDAIKSVLQNVFLDKVCSLPFFFHFYGIHCLLIYIHTWLILSKWIFAMKGFS
jgi:DNA-directed RNA polymerase subunit E'/Rpb7